MRDITPRASQTKMKQLNPHPTAVLPPKTLLSLAACQEWLRPTLDSRCCRRSVFILSNLSSWTLTKRKFSHASSKQPSPLVNVGRRHATKQHTLCFSVGCQSSTSTIQPPISNSFPTQQCPGIAYGTRGGSETASGEDCPLNGRRAFRAPNHQSVLVRYCSRFLFIFHVPS